MLLEMMLLAKLLAETPDASKGLVHCPTPTSQRWREVSDHRRALAFVAESKKSIELAEGGPFDCGLALEARCTPDLDGDGASDAIVRARWEERHAEDGGDESDGAQAARCHARRFVGSSAPYSSLFLVLSGGPSPGLGAVRLLADETGAGRGPTVVEATSWKGKRALKLELELTHSDSGETVHQQKVVVVEKGQVVEVSGEK